MTKTRLEAFSDGVLAIIITVMVLALKSPHGTTLAALRPTLPALLSYVLSYIYVGIYWNNHHHLLHATRSINGQVMWANLHLLFWLSLVPFVTGWLGESGAASTPAAVYGVVLLMAAVAYTILQTTILRHEGRSSTLAQAVGSDVKGKVSLVLYLAAIGLSFVTAWLSYALYLSVALLWLVPDRRIEGKVTGP